MLGARILWFSYGKKDENHSVNCIGRYTNDVGEIFDLHFMWCDWMLLLWYWNRSKYSSKCWRNFRGISTTLMWWFDGNIDTVHGTLTFNISQGCVYIHYVISSLRIYEIKGIFQAIQNFVNEIEIDRLDVVFSFMRRLMSEVVAWQ